MKFQKPKSKRKSQQLSLQNEEVKLILASENQIDMRIFLSNTRLQETMKSCFQTSEKNNLKLVYKCENKIKICIKMHRIRDIYLDFLLQKSKWHPTKQKRNKKIHREESMKIKNKI